MLIIPRSPSPGRRPSPHCPKFIDEGWQICPAGAFLRYDFTSEVKSPSKTERWALGKKPTEDDEAASCIER